jgi:hypothetical protein
MKEFGHMGTILGSFPRDLDRDDPETDLRKALMTGANGPQETRQILSTGAHDLPVIATETPALLSIGAQDLHVMETETPALLSIEVLGPHVMETETPALLSIEVLDLHMMGIGMLLTKAPIDPSKATAFSTMMCQSQYRTQALRASGYMVPTPSWQLCAATDAKFTN